MSDASNSFSIIALIASAAGAIISVIATYVVFNARRVTKRALVSKEGVLSRSESVEEYSGVKNDDDDEDAHNG
jgi:hypothetical protein